MFRFAQMAPKRLATPSKWKMGVGSLGNSSEIRAVELMRLTGSTSLTVREAEKNPPDFGVRV